MLEPGDVTLQCSATGQTYHSTTGGTLSGVGTPGATLSLAFEGWDAVLLGVRQADALTWAAVAWQAWANTLFGYVVWGWLLARYPAATITPMALLVPVFGMGTAALLLGETLPMWKLSAAALVMTGLALNLFWPRLRAALT